jgi:pimeloyl-ACP methyl ester carboxylesterase
MKNGHETGFAELPDGGRIAYEVQGKTHAGIPILLLRPLGGTMALWGSFATSLAEAFCVIAFDFRGSGRSSRECRTVSTRQLARDGLFVLEHLGVPRAHVFGISLGGMAATWLAIQSPTHVARLALASTPACGIELSETSIRRDLQLLSCFVHRSRAVEMCLARRVLSTRFRDAHPDDVLGIERAVLEAPATRRALIKHALAGLFHDARRELHRIEQPTLVLAGEDDVLVSNSTMHALADAIPHATFEVIGDAGHALTLEQPAATANRVGAFFATSSGATHPDTRCNFPSA